MIKVSIEVQSGAVRLGVAVHAENVQRALSLAAQRCSGKNCRVKLPIEAEGLFVGDSTVQVAIRELPEKVAA
jgi:hypothetical protein